MDEEGDNWQGNEEDVPENGTKETPEEQEIQPPAEPSPVQTFNSPETNPPLNRQQASQQAKRSEEEWGVDRDPVQRRPPSSSTERIVISEDLKLPLEISYQVITVVGRRGMGKSYTIGKIVEEMSRNRLQFCLFDPMSAHSLIQLPNLVHVTPTSDRKINMEKFLRKLKETNKSVIVDLSKLKLDSQRKILAEYTEMLIDNDLGKPLMTIIEECQDFIPQTMSLKVRSLQPIIRFTKLGRQRGYGVCFVTQRPASASKECLTQSSLYIVHNILNTTDLNALRDLLSFGTDKQLIRDILNDVTKFTPGYFVAYSPEFITENQGVVISKTSKRITEHRGKNVDIPIRRGLQRQPWEEGEGFETDGVTEPGSYENDDEKEPQDLPEEGVERANGTDPLAGTGLEGEPGETGTNSGSGEPGTTEGEDEIGPDGLPIHSPKRGSLVDKDLARDALGVGLGVFAGIMFFVVAKKVLEQKQEEE